MQGRYSHGGATVDIHIPKSDALKSAADEYERCVLCGRLTDTKKLTPVDARKNYIVGAGQLCGVCGESVRSELRFIDAE